MGGHALKTVSVTRKSADEYGKIKQEVAALFQGKLELAFIPDVPGKPDFGDLDILYKASDRDIRVLVEEVFHPNEIVRNGDVTSFDYKNFQIDMIKCIKFEMGQFYLSYGDFGSLIGRIVNFYGLKFGHEGLWMNVHLDEHGDPSHHSYGKIILTDDPREICTFLGVTYNSWATLQSKTDIFDFVRSSRFYNASFFNGNTKHPKRVRPMYLEFLEYCDASSAIEPPERKYIQMEALRIFNKQDEYKRIFKELEEKRTIREKFNGHIFLDFGIPAERIGESITSFKQSIAEFEDWVIRTSADEIRAAIHTFLKEKQAIR